MLRSLASRAARGLPVPRASIAEASGTWHETDAETPYSLRDPARPSTRRPLEPARAGLAGARRSRASRRRRRLEARLGLRPARPSRPRAVVVRPALAGGARARAAGAAPTPARAARRPNAHGGDNLGYRTSATSCPTLSDGSRSPSGPVSPSVTSTTSCSRPRARRALRRWSTVSGCNPSGSARSAATRRMSPTSSSLPRIRAHGVSTRPPWSHTSVAWPVRRRRLGASSM